MPRRFPDGFTWGTATAAHQIEGGNWNNDWWDVGAHAGLRAASSRPATPATRGTGGPTTSPSCADLGFGNYRFSIEWSRIEPEEGEWSPASIDHYRRQCEALLAAGVDPVVTFHHFTTPRWVAAQGRVGRCPPPPTASPPSAAAPPASSATCMQPGLHDQRAEHRLDDRATSPACSRPATRDVELRRRVNGVFVDAHRKAVDAIRDGGAGRARRRSRCR